jgi:hypothetical protein
MAQGLLPGCRLENGSLQCVPGLSASPQKQIQVMEGQINQDVQVEGHLEQAIEGLKRFMLVGEAREGQLLKTELMLEGADVETLEIHWYRRNGQGHWQLMEGISDRTYRISPEDRGDELMAVLVARSSDGSIRRISSNVIGPVKG